MNRLRADRLRASGRVVLGGAVCGSFVGIFAGGVLFALIGGLMGNVSAGLDGALSGGGFGFLAGAVYGLVLAASEDGGEGASPADESGQERGTSDGSPEGREKAHTVHTA